jgi:plasmid stabilization system protein ParE
LLDRHQRYDVRPAQLGLSRIRSGSHFIYFQDDREAVIIVRVLHVAMDLPRHIG